MKKLMAFFAFISIIILTIPVNCYSWAAGTERSTMLANDNPFISYFFAHYIPNLYNSNNFFSEYGIPNNMSTGSILNHMRLYGYDQPYNYGWNQPYNYGWNQPYNYGWNQPYKDAYQADTYGSDWRTNRPYNYGPGTFPWWDYPPYSNPSILGIEEPPLW